MKKGESRFVLSKVMNMLFAGILILSFCPVSFAVADEKESKQETVQNKNTREKYELETITVTSQKREENIQEVPASITALSEIQIEDAGIQDMEDLGFYTPNLYIGKAGNNAELTPVIRGMYNRMNPNPTVGLYVDDVSYSRHMAFDTDLSDIERIEVLKGPQGTLFGRNTEAGVIRIITKKPGDIWEGRASLTYGNYDTQEYSAAARGPLVEDKLFFGISAKQYSSDGYFENTYLGTDDVEKRDDLSGRATLRWTPAPAWDIILNANAQQCEDGFFAFAPFGEMTHEVSVDYPGSLENDLSGQSLSANYEGEGFTFTSITAHRDGDYSNTYDAGATVVDDYRADYGQDHGQWSQEIRFASPKNAKVFKWLVGAYYLDEDFDVSLIYDYRQGYPAYGLPPYKSAMITELDTTNYAFFGQATYTLWEKLGLTAGLRYENDKKEFKANTYNSPDVMGTGTTAVEDEKTLDVWLPKFAVDYRFTRDVMSYASVARGYTAGSFNDLDASVLGIPYDAEYSWNYEAGLKTAWLDNQLILNFSVFYIEWEDKQVFIHTGATNAFFKNATEATNKGFELEALVRPVPGLELVGGVGYTDAEYGKWESGEDYEGNKLEMAPEFSYNLAAQYRYTLSDSASLFCRLELQHVGDFYHDLDNERKESAYNLVNARVGYEGEFRRLNVGLYLWAKNLLDEEYATCAFGSDSMGWFAHAGDPQTVGVTLTCRF
ncbi:TonB-dependent receptor [Desulfobacter curvatus]|uniref:TonB-dependent receptor n=1 Tax=Desulfobacter curvatus TaxID=2290 RepID=UPI00037BEE36|nr:TonB-dependent receptor [Desulfobacter curvatus]